MADNSKLPIVRLPSLLPAKSLTGAELLSVWQDGALKRTTAGAFLDNSVGSPLSALLDEAVEEATSAALTARDQAQAVVASGRVAYDTLAGLNANLTPAAGAQGEVLADGTNNGLYVKSGASGTGSWVKKSGATVTALDYRTRNLSDFETIEGDLEDVVDEDGRLINRIDKQGSVHFGYAGSLSGADTLEGDLEDAVDEDGRLLWRLAKDGALHFGQAGSIGEYETLEGDLDDVVDVGGRLVLRIDKDGKLHADLATPVETVADPGQIHRWGTETLRQAHMRLRKRSAPLLESTQLVVATIGDSWTHNNTRWSGPFASTLISDYGDAGGGWVGFGSASGFDNGNVRPTLYTYARSGTWTFTYASSPSPDICHANSSTAASKITLTGPATPVLSLAKFFWVGTADGVMQYRWNGGSWTSINVQGTVGSLQTADLAGLPSSGAWTLELEVVSGTCSPAGVDFQSAADGVRVNKIAATGSRLAQWAAVDSTNWQAGLAALAPHLVSILHGTNDQGAGRSPAQYAIDLATLIDRIRTACPGADILVIMPAENGRTNNPFPMAEYTAAAYPVVVQKKVAFLNLQPDFGSAFASYSSTSALPLMNADLIHPEPQTGGRVIADSILRAILYA